MNPFRNNLISDYYRIINNIHREWQTEHYKKLGTSEPIECEHWVEISLTDAAYQFPLQAITNLSSFPIHPIPMKYVGERMDRLQRYNGGTIINRPFLSVLDHTLRGYTAYKTRRDRNLVDVLEGLTGLYFLLHDIEETIIGDIIMPVEKALGLDLRRYKEIIRGKLFLGMMLGANISSDREWEFVLKQYMGQFTHPETKKKYLTEQNEIDHLSFCYEVQSQAKLPLTMWEATKQSTSFGLTIADLSSVSQNWRSIYYNQTTSAAEHWESCVLFEMKFVSEE